VKEREKERERKEREKEEEQEGYFAPRGRTGRRSDSARARRHFFAHRCFLFCLMKIVFS